ncbi:MAG: hypothetical protein R3F27_11350 [Gammaproteobacteria bacterium]
MKFPHADNCEIDDRDFLFQWASWFQGPESTGKRHADEAVPRLAQAASFENLLEGGRGHGLDALCRSVVPHRYRNTMQATSQFMKANDHILKATRCVNPASGITVEGATLTDEGLRILKQLDTEALGRNSKNADPAEAIISRGTGRTPVTSGDDGNKVVDFRIAPLLQVDCTSDTGETTIREVRAVTNAIMAWWEGKGDIEIDISDDGSRSTLTSGYSVKGDGFPDGCMDLTSYIEAYEDEQRATIFNYYDGLMNLHFGNRGQLLELVNNVNISTPYGCWELVSQNDSTFAVRYTNSICLRNAGEAGPSLIENMVEAASEIAPAGFSSLLNAIHIEDE